MLKYSSQRISDLKKKKERESKSSMLKRKAWNLKGFETERQNEENLAFICQIILSINLFHDIWVLTHDF